MAEYASEEFICVISGSPGATKHHLTTRGSGGTDAEHNMIPVAQVFHQMFHNKGTNYMAVKFPAVLSWLKQNGWEYCPVLCKWRHN